MGSLPSLSFRKGDWIAVSLVLLLALVLLLFLLPKDRSGEEAVVQVYRDGDLLREFPLSVPQTLSFSEPYPCTLEIRDGRVAMIQSDCPGGDCLHTGWISQPGRAIVCLPNRLEIRILGQAEVDFVVR